jgi:hypothetical protein
LSSDDELVDVIANQRADVDIKLGDGRHKNDPKKINLSVKIEINILI